MKMKKITLLMTALTTSALLVGCVNNEDKNNTTSSTQDVQQTPSKKKSLTKGKIYTEQLGATNWQGTKVYDSNGNDLTKENSNFIGLAKYDDKTNLYEFFDKTTGESRGDSGTFFITNDGEKRVLISSTQNYQAIVDITELSDKIFTYKRMGVDKDGKEIEVFVEHIPYSKKELNFTKNRESLNSKTGEIDFSRPGDQILSKTLWNGTVVIDKDGNDLTKENQMFISLAKFDYKTSQYEFFDKDTGESRGDFGYFSVLFNNKLRSHVSIGENKYGAVLEITELNDKKFTYKRMGKDKYGKDIEVFVEHKPYGGTLNPEFTF